MVSIFSNFEQPDIEEEDLRPTKKHKTNDSDNFFGKFFIYLLTLIGSTRKKKPLNNKILEAEIATYFLESEIQLSSNPLQWWQMKEPQYPNLAKVARKYLCIPATSASSERVFSVAGLASHDRRSRISPDKLDKVIFINKNMKGV